MKFLQNRKLLVVTLAIAIFHFPLIGQNFNIKSGLLLSKYTLKNVPPNLDVAQESKPNLFISLNTEIPINDRLKIETGLSINSKGSREDYFKSREVTSTLELDSLYSVRITYLEIPVLAKRYFHKGKMKFYGALGPYFSVGLNGRTKSVAAINKPESSTTKADINWGSNDEINSFSRIDYGLQFNLGVELKSFQMGVIYGLGLHKLSIHNDVNSRNIKNRTWSFYVGYRFFDDNS